MVKHNNMRDDEAQHAYDKAQSELDAQVDDIKASFLRLVDTLVDGGAIGPIVKRPIDDKGTLTVVQTDGHFTIDDNHLLGIFPPKSVDSVPDSDDYKARYEQAMELVEDMLQYEAHPSWDYYRKYKARYDKLRDSNE